MTTPAKPPRRRGEARQAIIDAARELFGARGYQGASLRDIAAAANVSEALIFRNFATKENLFEEAVAEPYRRFLTEFGQRWEQLQKPQPNEQMIETFVTELYDFVREHRDLLFALVVAARFNSSSEHAATRASALSREIHDLAAITTREADWRGLEHVDHDLAASFTIATVFAVVLLDDALFSHDTDRPSHKRLMKAMTAYTVGGILQAHRSG